MPEPTVPVSVVPVPAVPVPTVPVPADSPAAALGPTALVLGVLSAVGACVPALTLITLPWTIIGGALAVTFGAAGIHYARHGTGRLWVAATGTVLGAVALAAVATLIGAFG
ncbi:hypothetical protein ACIQVO_27170 [Streptomyces sp. NPDC101062]|uniref:hypothetical protein n=1 Tax=unclassified Streptomyces TaxID=2593676 RepID=UPI0037FE0DCD